MYLGSEKVSRFASLTSELKSKELVVVVVSAVMTNWYLVYYVDYKYMYSYNTYLFLESSGRVS